MNKNNTQSFIDRSFFSRYSIASIAKAVAVFSSTILTMGFISRLGGANAFTIDTDSSTKRAVGDEFSILGSSVVYTTPAVASSTDGFAVISQTGVGSGKINTTGQLFDNSGQTLGNSFFVGSHLNSGGNTAPAALTYLPDKSFVVVWTDGCIYVDGSDGSKSGIFGQHFSSSAAPIGARFAVNSNTSNTQEYPAITRFGSGFFVAWESSPVGYNPDICGQRFDSAHMRLGGEIKLNSITTGVQEKPKIAELVGSGMVASWFNRAQFGGNTSIQIFNNNAAPIGSEIIFASYGAPSITALTNDFIVSYIQSGLNFAARFYNSSQSSLGAEFTAVPSSGGSMGVPLPIASFMDGKFIIAAPRLLATGGGSWDARCFTKSLLAMNSLFRINITTPSPAIPSITISDTSDGNVVAVWRKDTTTIGGSIFNCNTPNIINNRLMLVEGQRITLDNSMLLITELNLANSSLIFNATQILEGQFELANQPNLPITIFNQEQINTKLVQFVHNGSELAPSFKLVVNDNAVYVDTQVIINFTNVNDPPILLMNQLIIKEGQTLTLTSFNLNASDSDNTNDQIHYQITALQQGEFRFFGSSTPIINFTQMHINNGMIQFVHDGFEVAPAYNVTVSDGLLSTGPFIANVTFTLENDPPVIVNHQFSITQGAVVSLSPLNISASDIDSNNMTLFFQVSGNQHGQFQLNNDTTPVFGFTQQQIYLGELHFSHDNSSFPPTATIVVSDGLLSSPPQQLDISYRSSNSTLLISLAVNTLTIYEGESVVLTSANLAVQDSAASPNDTRFSINNLQHGKFVATDNNTLVLQGFSQQQLMQGLVTFTHDGFEVAPSFEVSVTDGVTLTAYSPCRITFQNINDAPTLENFNLVVSSPNQNILLDSSKLSATDPDSALSTLQFSLSNIVNGQFESVTSPGIAITSFSQQQIQNGFIQYVHKGSENLPQFTVSVSDGSLNSPPQQAMTFYLLKNSLVIQPNETLIMTTANINLLSNVPDNQTIINVFNLQNGRFGLTNQAGASVLTFNLRQVAVGEIQFIKDSSDIAPSYGLKFGYFGMNQLTSAHNAEIRLNHRPIVKTKIDNQQLGLNEDVDFTLAENTFDDIDRDALRVSAQFQNGSQLPNWLTFQPDYQTQRHRFFGKPQQVDAYDLQVMARDPYNATTAANFLLQIAGNLTQINSEVNTPIIAGAAAGGAALLAAVIGLAVWYRRHAQDKNSREKHELARYIRRALKLQNVDNFESEQGRKFIAAAQNIADELIRQGIGLKNFDTSELLTLANQIADSAKNKITPTTSWGKSIITVSEFEGKINEIVANVLLLRSSGYINDANRDSVIEMGVFKVSQ